MDVAAIAAFAAAGVSLINAGLTVRGLGHNEISRWRRDAERPVVVTLLAETGNALNSWTAFVAMLHIWKMVREDSAARDEEMKENLVEATLKGRVASYEVRKCVETLELLASRDLRELARELYNTIDEVTRGLFNPKTAFDLNTLETKQEYLAAAEKEVTSCEQLVRLAARRDLGLA